VSWTTMLAIRALLKSVQRAVSTNLVKVLHSNSVPFRLNVVLFFQCRGQAFGLLGLIIPECNVRPGLCQCSCDLVSDAASPASDDHDLAAHIEHLEDAIR